MMKNGTILTVAVAVRALQTDVLAFDSSSLGRIWDTPMFCCQQTATPRAGGAASR